jgi:hypothetical protein
LTGILRELDHTDVGRPLNSSESVVRGAIINEDELVFDSGQRGRNLFLEFAHIVLLVK